MSKTIVFTPVFVEFVPDQLEDGKLYISKEYGTAIHLCACGCGNKTVTPIRGVDSWAMRENGDKISISPSIGNWHFPCRSHYFITDNEVRWAP